MVTLKVIVLGTLMFLSLPYQGHSKKANKKNSKAHKKRPSSSTFVGKYISTQCIEYEALNGWMTPKTAKRLCDEDLACAGFTYKGSIILYNH